MQIKTGTALALAAKVALGALLAAAPARADDGVRWLFYPYHGDGRIILGGPLKGWNDDDDDGYYRAPVVRPHSGHHRRGWHDDDDDDGYRRGGGWDDDDDDD